MSVSIKGLDSLSKQLNQLADNARELSNTKSVSFTEILSPEFIAQHTGFSNVDEFLKASGFDVSDQATFEAIPEENLDAFVASVSSFSSWREMLNSAEAVWAKRKLGL